MSFRITVQRAQKCMSTSLILFSYFEYFIRELSGIPELSWKLQTQIINYWSLKYFCSYNMQAKLLGTYENTFSV